MTRLFPRWHTGTARAVWLVLVGFSAIGCYGAARPDTKVARLRVLAEPDQATVYVDDRFAGSARVLAVRPHSLPPGRHFVTITAPDHFPHDLMVDLEPGDTTVRVTLRPVPP